MTTIGPQTGTCAVCGQQIRIVNYQPAGHGLPELGYLARHWRPGLRPGYQVPWMARSMDRSGC